MRNNMYNVYNWYYSSNYKLKFYRVLASVLGDLTPEACLPQSVVGLTPEACLPRSVAGLTPGAGLPQSYP